ncbi:MAG: hypothetical protein LBS00_11585 [Synergistaceae bacterium]|jgi:hypothetical protein|nr:hypothetical protein [Synergistaceae bacterium]
MWILSSFVFAPPFVLLVLVDGSVRPSAAVKLADLVKLGGERPLNLTYSKSVRFILANESGKTATLAKLSIFVR